MRTDERLVELIDDFYVNNIKHPESITLGAKVYKELKKDIKRTTIMTDNLFCIKTFYGIPLRVLRMEGNLNDDSVTFGIDTKYIKSNKDKKWNN